MDTKPKYKSGDSCLIMPYGLRNENLIKNEDVAHIGIILDVNTKVKLKNEFNNSLGEIVYFTYNVFINSEISRNIDEKLIIKL